jgi:cytochrome oxidase Cu insertion factor (SCO1/SenC/PrrC family)
MMLRFCAFSLLTAVLAAQSARLHPVPDLDKNMKTGPSVGERIPSFQLPDQNGVPRTFANLRGPKGLVLLFVRSADW